MRKQTLAGVCSLISFAIVYGLKTLAAVLGFRVPLFVYVEPLVVALVLIPLLTVPMAMLNERLLAWRKARGRDMVEEEKYENETAGIISLRPVDHESELKYRRR